MEFNTRTHQNTKEKERRNGETENQRRGKKKKKRPGKNRKRAYEWKEKKKPRWILIWDADPIYHSKQYIYITYITYKPVYI